MATVNVTARYLDLLKPQRKRYEVFDTIVPGFAIRVTPAGHKSFSTTDTTADSGESAWDATQTAEALGTLPSRRCSMARRSSGWKR